MIEPIPALVEVFAGLSDWRKPKGKRYAIGTVLTVTILAILSGENSVRGIAAWVKEQRVALQRGLGLKRSRMPGYETIRTVLRDLDIVELERRLHDWAAQVYVFVKALVVQGLYDSPTHVATPGHGFQRPSRGKKGEVLTGVVDHHRADLTIVL